MELCVVVPTLNEKENIPLLIKELNGVLQGINWELIIVDDNSTDSTADLVRKLGKTQPNIRCIQRLNRRGLSSACVEGMLATNADYLAVMDADLQHDTNLLKLMFTSLQTNADLDIAIGSRYIDRGSTGELTERRVKISKFSNKLASILLKTQITDPMSGFFMLKRRLFDRVSQKLSQIGFKILVDIIASAKYNVQLIELPYTMRSRKKGESKLNTLISLEYFMLLLDKWLPFIPWRFVLFILVGFTGLFLHMTCLYFLLNAGISFVYSQIISTAIAILNNFYLNNKITYRDSQLSGINFYKGLVKFYLACSLGAVMNVTASYFIYNEFGIWWLAAFIGAIIGSIWNFAVNNYITWKPQ